MRLAIENGALQPATRHLGGFEHGIFQVGLRATIAATDHRPLRLDRVKRSEEHTSELQSLMRISYAVFCLKKKKNSTIKHQRTHTTADRLIIKPHLQM